MAYGTLPPGALNATALVERPSRTRNEEGESVETYLPAGGEQRICFQEVTKKLLESSGGGLVSADHFLAFLNDADVALRDRVTVTTDAGASHVVEITKVWDAASMGHHFEAFADRWES